MKHIKTFESFTVNEEILGFSKAEKEKAFMKEAERNYGVWNKKLPFRPLTKDEIEEMLVAARADNFEGKPGHEKGPDGKHFMRYMPQSEVGKKFSYSSGGHAFGSGE